MGGFWSEQVLGSLDVGTIRNTTAVSIIFQLVLMHVDALNLSSNLHEFMPAACGHCMLLYQQHIQVRYGKLVSLHCMKHVTSPFCIFLNTWSGDPHPAPDPINLDAEVNMAYNVEPLRLSSKGPFELLLVLKSLLFHGAVPPGLIEYRRRLCFWYEVTAPNDQYPWLMKQYISWPYKRFWLD